MVAAHERPVTRVVVLWDFDNLPPPGDSSPIEVYRELRQSLTSKGFYGPGISMELKAYVTMGHAYAITEPELQALRNMTFDNIVCTKRKEDADRQISSRIIAASGSADAATTVIVIMSSDQDFVSSAKYAYEHHCRVVTVHGAAQGSQHEQMLGLHSAVCMSLAALIRRPLVPRSRLETTRGPVAARAQAPVAPLAPPPPPPPPFLHAAQATAAAPPPPYAAPDLPPGSRMRHVRDEADDVAPPAAAVRHRGTVRNYIAATRLGGITPSDQPTLSLLFQAKQFRGPLELLAVGTPVSFELEPNPAPGKQDQKIAVRIRPEEEPRVRGRVTHINSVKGCGGVTPVGSVTPLLFLQSAATPVADGDEVTFFQRPNPRRAGEDMAVDVRRAT